MSPRTFVIMGRSGAGKGTQAQLLIEYLKSNDDEKRDIFYLETGERFRDFIKQGGYSGRLAGEINKTGGLQPAFLAVWNWAHLLVEKLTGEEHLIADGTPRSYQEALVFDSAMVFYGRVRPVVIHLDVHREWSHDRLLSRGRADDKTEDEIEKRLSWFDTDVAPAIDFFKEHSNYVFLRIDGERSVEKVHEDIVAELERNG